MFRTQNKSPLYALQIQEYLKVVREDPREKKIIKSFELKIYSSIETLLLSF
jgi:hypothetical protein